MQASVPVYTCNLKGAPTNSAAYLSDRLESSVTWTFVSQLDCAILSTPSKLSIKSESLNFNTFSKGHLTMIQLYRHCGYIAKISTRNVYYSCRKVLHSIGNGPQTMYSIQLESNKNSKIEGYAVNVHYSYR